MNSASIVWQVAKREITERGRSKAYLITTAATLLLIVGLILAPGLIGDETDVYEIAVVGEGSEQIVDAAEALGNATDEPDAEPSVEMNQTHFDIREEADTALREGDVVAVLIDGEEIVVESVGGFGGSPLVSLLQRGAATLELENIVSEEGQVAADVIEVMTSDPLEVTALSGPDSGDETAGVVAYVGLILLYVAVLLYGTWILTGVTEEKSNRVVEVLLSSIRPWHLLAGKVLGIGALGLAQFAGTILVAMAVLQITDVLELPALSVAAIATLIIWFILGFLLFAIMFGAAGSLVSRTEEAQNVAFPMSMVAVAGFFLSIVALDDPGGTAATVGTFIPLTAPFVVPVRAALDAIPWWQYAVAVLLTVAAISGMTLVAGRIYAGALLRYGGRTKLREAWRSSAETR